MKLSKREFAVTLCDLHRLQKAVEFERAFGNWKESEKQEIYFSNQLLGLFIYRIQRDPGFAWYIFFRVSDDEQILQQTLQYINTLWDIWGEGLNDLYTFPTPSPHASSRRFEALRDEVWHKFQGSKHGSEYICPFGCTANEVFLGEYCVETDVSSEMYRSARYLQTHNVPQGDAELFTYFDPLGSKPLERGWKQYLFKKIHYPRYYTSDKQHYCQNEMPYLPTLRRRFAETFGFGMPDEAWLEAEWKQPNEKNPYSEEQRFEQLQNLVFTTSALMIAAEIWFRHLRCEEQSSLLNQEYLWPPEDEILRREVPAVVRHVCWHQRYQIITSSPAASLDLRGSEIMEAITLIESGKEEDGYSLLISWFARDSRNISIHNIRQIGYAFLAHGLNPEKILPQLCDVLITDARYYDPEIADLFAEFCLYSCGEEWFIRQGPHEFRLLEKADWYLGRAKLAYAAGDYKKACALCRNAIDVAEKFEYWTNLPNCYLLMADISDAEGELRRRHSYLYQYISSKKRILDTSCIDSEKRQIMSFIQLDDLLSRTPLWCEVIIDADDAKKTFQTAEYILNRFREKGKNTNIDYSMPFGWIGKGVEILINTKVLIPAREQISNELLCECKKLNFSEWEKRFFYDKQTVSCGTFSNFISNGEVTEERSNPVMSEFCQKILSIYSWEILREMANIAKKIADYRNPSMHHAIFTKEEMNREWAQASSLVNKLIHLIYPITEKQSEKMNTLTILHQKDPDNQVVSRLLEIQKGLIDKSGD